MIATCRDRAKKKQNQDFVRIRRTLKKLSFDQKGLTEVEVMQLSHIHKPI